MNDDPRTAAATPWYAASLARKLSLPVIATLVVTSAVFLFLFVHLYEKRLVDEMGAASAQVNQLLAVSLENAMLKRDLDGLRGIVERLGRQQRIADVMIVNPAGEVRFTARPEALGARFEVADILLAAEGAVEEEATATSAFVQNERGEEVLRSINPVRNRAECVTCHGAPADHPVNGILVIDYDASAVKKDALLGALMFSGSGAVVLLIALLGIWTTFRRSVLHPIGELASASESLAEGNMSVRTGWQGGDELGRLGQQFDGMADRLEQSMVAVQTRERLLQSLIDAVPDGIRLISVDDYQVVKANTEYCKQSGRKMEDVIGRPCYETSHGRSDPCAPTLVTCPLRELDKDNDSVVCRHRHQDAGGFEFPVEVSAAWLEHPSNGDGSPLVVESIRDLAQDVKISHEQKLSEIGVLATGVAHEIHNPLSSIRLTIKELQRGFEHDGEPQRIEDIRIIDEEIDKCIEVTDRLLRLSVPAAKRPELVAFDAIVPEVMSLLRYEAQKDHVSVDLDLEPNLRVLASDSEIRMLVLNIAQNAFHAMPEGGRFHVSGRKIDGEIELVFEDEGVGISTEDRARIFDPFWSRRADDVRGTGLGLSICKAIVARYHGIIRVESELGQGTRFFVRFADADLAVEAIS